MSLDWYPAFYVAVFLVWLAASARDRVAARIVLAATVGSWLITRGVTVHISGAWKLAIPGTVETVTLACLLAWARSPAGLINAAAVAAAWCAHLLCYVDCVAGTNLVYDNYEALLAAVAAVQLAAFHDTYRSCLARAGVILRGARHAALRDPGDRHSLVRGLRAARPV